MVTPVAMEPLLGYHPCSTGFLTSSRDPAGGQCQVGSLIRRSPPERASRRSKFFRMKLETIRRVQRQKGSLTATPTGGAGNEK